MFSRVLHCCSHFSVFLVVTCLAILISPSEQTMKSAEDNLESKQTSQNALALVPYEENDTPLQRFYKKSWEFKFCEQTIKIRQDWNQLGVAGVVWDAAVVLSEYLEKNKHIVLGKRVVELGAGTGLVGIVAALLGANILITDREEALPHLRDIVTSNIPLEMSHQVRVAALDWTESLEKYSQPFDVILGADVIYIEETFPHLLKTLIHLSNAETVILLSCRIRYDRDTNFLELMAEKFTVEKIFEEKERDIRIYSAKKKS